MFNLGNRVEFYRKKRGLSRKQLCENLCDESTVFRLEKNKHIPRLDILEGIAAKLDISIQNLLAYKDRELQKINILSTEAIYSNNYSRLNYILEELQHLINRRGIECPSLELLSKYYSWYQAILLYKQKNNYKDAIKTLEKILDKNTYREELDIDILNTLGQIHMDLNQLQEAYIYINKAYQLVLKKLPTLEDLPLFPRISFHFVLVLYHMQDYDEALQVCHSVLSYLKSNRLIHYRGEINQLCGNILLNKNLHNEANKHFQQAKLFFLIEEDHHTNNQLRV